MNTNIQPIHFYRKAYFLGIGGIGMSAIARYLLQQGLEVKGYDKTPTPLTTELMEEGAQVVFDDDEKLLPVGWEQQEDVLWIITPAIPVEHRAWKYLQSLEVPIFKRSEVLGSIARNGFCIAVAGTHGKTTTSTLIAHLLHTCNINFTAFLGGISANYNSNYVRKSDGISWEINGENKEIIVLEADEFDRSFHRLNPDLAVITAMDPDHLDIYETPQLFAQAFNHFAELIRNNPNTHSTHQLPRGGGLVLNEKLQELVEVSDTIELVTYGKNQNSAVQYQSVNIQNGEYHFDYLQPYAEKQEFKCGLPGFHNVENATAALAITQYFLQLPWDKLQQGIQSFKGAKRRFEYIIRTANHVVIDDYAHHPEELNAIISSVKALYPNQQLTGIFQPHLFSRTRDFAEGFADSLSKLDECWLMDIYPAREKPIPGITSQWLLEKLSNTAMLLDSPGILHRLQTEPKKLLLILGAGDIDKLVSPIKEIYIHL